MTDMNNIKSILDRLKSDDPGGLEFDMDVMKARGEIDKDALLDEFGVPYLLGVLHDSGVRGPRRQAGRLLKYTTSEHPQDCHWEAFPAGYEPAGILRDYQNSDTREMWFINQLIHPELPPIELRVMPNKLLPRAFLIAAFEAILVVEAAK